MLPISIRRNCAWPIAVARALLSSTLNPQDEVLLFDRPDNTGQALQSTQCKADAAIVDDSHRDNESGDVLSAEQWRRIDASVESQRSRGSRRSSKGMDRFPRSKTGSRASPVCARWLFLPTATRPAIAFTARGSNGPPISCCNARNRTGSSHWSAPRDDRFHATLITQLAIRPRITTRFRLLALAELYGMSELRRAERLESALKRRWPPRCRCSAGQRTGRRTRVVGDTSTTSMRPTPICRSRVGS